MVVFANKGQVERRKNMWWRGSHFFVTIHDVDTQLLLYINHHICPFDIVAVIIFTAIMNSYDVVVFDRTRAQKAVARQTD